MRLIDVAVWWNSAEEQAEFEGPQFKILDHHADNRRFDYLSNSNGACCSGWVSMGDRGRAAALLAMVFQAIVVDGVPVAEVSKEMREIDEYALWQDAFEGPFAEIYRGD